MFKPRHTKGGDKMWVRVTGRRGGRYVGVLNNEPTDPALGLRLGDEVTFGARNIFDIVAARKEPPRRSAKRVVLDFLAGF